MSSLPTALPTPPSSDRSSSDQQQAKKRAVLRNDATLRTDLNVPPQSRLAREGFTYEKFRVGCPPLALLPLHFTDLHGGNRAYQALRWQMPRFHEVLQNFHIEIDYDRDIFGNNQEVRFGHRTREYEDPSDSNIFVFIPAVWNDNRPLSWLQAVNEIRNILGENPFTRRVGVEMMGRYYFKEWTMKVIEDDHPIIAVWHRIQPEIHSILAQSQFLRDRWCSIAVIRLGHITEDGPPLPTVVAILVDWDVNPLHWEDAQLRINSLLTSHNLPNVRADFSRGGIVRDTFPLLKPTTDRKVRPLKAHAYQQKVAMGTDMGPARYFEKAPGEKIGGPCGTLGGYVDVKDNQTGEVTRMGVTNHHVVRQVLPGFSYTVSQDVDRRPLEAPASQGSDLESEWTKCIREF